MPDMPTTGEPVDSEGAWPLDDVTRTMLSELAAVPAPDAAAAAAAVGALPVVRQVEALLSWLAPSRPVGDDLGLGLDDVPAAAALVGADVDLTQVTRMWDVQRLRIVWLNAGNADLVEVSGSYARPTALGRAWLHGTDEGAGPAAVLGHLITECVGGGPPRGLRPSSRIIGIVTCVLGGYPFPLVEPEATLRALGQERFGARGDTMFFTGLDATTAHRAFSQAPPRPGIDVLVAEGVLQVDSQAQVLTVTPGLEHLVARSMQREIRELHDFFGGDLGS